MFERRSHFVKHQCSVVVGNGLRLVHSYQMLLLVRQRIFLELEVSDGVGGQRNFNAGLVRLV